MNVNELRNRTVTLAEACIKVSILLPGQTPLLVHVKDSLMKNATELGVKSRILGRPQHSEFFIQRLNQTVDATNACAFWLEMVLREQWMDTALISPLIEECDELLSMFLMAARKSKDKLE